MPISEIFHGDCMEYMRTIPDKYFDLCIADPPYGINAAKMTMGSGKNKQWTKKRWDVSIPHDDVFREMLRVAKHAIIWGGNYFACLPPTKAWIVWDKGHAGGNSFADGELAWTTYDKVLRIARVLYSGFLGADTCRIHPTQKPVALYAWIIDNYAIGGG
jgi:site-specific DNA-methyltransferase (adenine-specific)